MIAGRTWRLLALIAPALIVPIVATDQQGSRVGYATGVALSVLWLIVAAALVVRFTLAMHAQLQSRDAPSAWDRIDLLTASGAAMMWGGLAALLGSVWTGWASLSVLGVMGVGTVSISVLWTAIVAAGNRPWRRAAVERAVLPALATEGDPLREEITLRDLAIPPGMRLFILGRPQRHGAISRYVVEASELGGEAKLESDLGPALRGEHRAPPLALWFGDALGLTRTAAVHRGAAEFVVVPKPVQVDHVQRLLGPGGDAALSIPATQMPTEGTFRIKEYAPGDDARRIHWVRSLQHDQLIVRLPDEVPPADPAVRLVLDSELSGTDVLTCYAPDEMLDVLVRVWLGIGKALAAQGTRVTLAAAVREGDATVMRERKLHARSAQPAQRFGARIGWQTALPLDRLVGGRRERQVIVSARPRRIANDAIGWVVVPEAAWTSFEPDLPLDHATCHRYPLGSPENRRDRRSYERLRAATRWQDRAVFSQVMCWIDWSKFSGDHVAKPHHDKVELEVIP
ncbi:MAG: DUF58 domain-containing protein [Kofleriaceae bacterium]